MKKVAFGQNCSRVVISSIASDVHLVREVSSKRHYWATWMVRSVVTLGNLGKQHQRKVGFHHR